MDRGAWLATVLWVEKESDTTEQLNTWHTRTRVCAHTHTHLGFVLKISVNILRSEKGACFIPVRVPSTRC